MRLLKREGYENLLLPSHTELDFCNQAAVDRYFQEWNPEYVFYTAAKMGSIIYRNEHPAAILYDNIIMQTNIVCAAHKYGAKNYYL